MKLPSSHLLSVHNAALTADGASPHLIGTVEQALQTIAARAGSLAGLLVVGSISSNARPDEFQAADRFIDLALGQASALGIISSDGACPVITVPGPGDREPLSARRAVVRSLQGPWTELEPLLFSGAAAEELEAIREAFGYYELWSEDRYANLPGRHSGTVPGDGSCTLEISGARIGVISVNAAARMLAAPAVEGLACLGVGQVADALGTADVAAWARERDLTLLVASHGDGASDLDMGSVLGLFSDATTDSAPVGPLAVWPVGASTVALLDVDAALSVTSISPAVSEAESDAGAEAATEGPAHEAGAAHSFAADISTGRAALLVFDGLQQAVGRASGATTGGRAELRRQLLKVMGVEKDDRRTELGDLLRYARQRDAGRARAVLQSVCAVGDAASLDVVGSLLRAPWAHVWDTTSTDVYQRALHENTPLASTVAIIDAAHDATIKGSGVRQVVALNSNGHRSPDDVVFAPTAHGKGPRDTWHRRLGADFVTRPVVILAETTDDPDLWSYLDLRGEPPPESSRPVPRTYLVCPDVAPDVRWRLTALGVTVLELTVERFVSEQLAPSRAEVNAGVVALARVGTRSRTTKGLRLLSALLGEYGTRGDVSGASGDFLRGHDPSWQDIAAERPPRLSRLAHLTERTRLESGQRNVVVLRGRSGAGKTTTLMQLGADLVRAGLVVGWVDRFFHAGRKALVNDAIDMELDALLIDDVDMFGSETGPTMQLLNRNGKVLVVASIRRTASYALEGFRAFTEMDQDEPLTDEDIHKVIDALRAHSLLNTLRSVRPASARISRFRELSSRDLMAGLIQVVEGAPFDNRIASEYEQLQGRQRTAYGVISLASYIGEAPSTPIDYVVQVISESPPYRDAQAAIDALIVQRLVVEDGAGGVKCRHRAIADRVVDTMTRGGGHVLAEALGSLLFFYAEQAHNLFDAGHPDRRQMIALLNHNLMRKLGLPASVVRELYDSVHEFLEEDLHYWLQRGSYEVEGGHFDRAQGYLRQAQGCVGGSDDYKVMTEWASLQMKHAAARPRSSRQHEAAVLGLEALEAVGKQHGRNSPHTFAVAARDGALWLGRTRVVQDSDRRDLAVRIQDLIRLGRQVSKNAVFLEAADKAEPVLAKLSAAPDDGVPIV